MIIDLLKGHCPHCRQAKIFAGLMRMNETCPHCNIRFEREHGYFLMAIFIAYGIQFALLIPIIVYLYVQRVSIVTTGIVIMGALLLFAPLAFRVSRIIWLYIDEWLHPHSDEADLPIPTVDKIDFT